MATFEERLKGARKAAGFNSQAALARAVGLERATINQWERGTQPFTDGKYLLPLAKVLNVNPRWLLFHEGEPNPLQELNADELDLLLAFRQLRTEEARNAVVTLTRNMMGK